MAIVLREPRRHVQALWMDALKANLQGCLEAGPPTCTPMRLLMSHTRRLLSSESEMIRSCGEAQREREQARKGDGFVWLGG